MITSIIFSKNRPLQLDLCLSSIAKNFPDSSQIIVIHNNDPAFDEAHNVLCQEHSHIESWKQSSSIFNDVSIATLGAKNDYICFFTDDCMVYREVPFTTSEIIKLFHDPMSDTSGHELKIACISLRLGTNTTLRYYGDGQHPALDNLPVKVKSDGMFLYWSRGSLPPGGYWSYPLSVDGHIFEKTHIALYCDELKMLDKIYRWKQTPNEFEAKLQRFYFELPIMMASPTESCVVNSPNNRVQDSHQNRSGDFFAYDSKFLLDKYITGHRINLEDLNFNDIRTPHTEINLIEGLYVK